MRADLLRKAPEIFEDNRLDDRTDENGAHQNGADHCLDGGARINQQGVGRHVGLITPTVLRTRVDSPIADGN